MSDDLKLSLESTWIESGSASPYPRVVVLGFFTVDCMDSGSGVLRTVGQPLRDRVVKKLQADIGLIHGDDYVFGVYDNPKLSDGRWQPAPVFGGQRTIIRLLKEEHFTMLKMHYHVN